MYDHCKILHIFFFFFFSLFSFIFFFFSLSCFSFFLRSSKDFIEGINWNPSVGVAGALLGCVSLLSEPNFDDPANADAAALLKNTPTKFHLAVRTCVERSQMEIPSGWKSPDEIVDEKLKKKLRIERALGGSGGGGGGGYGGGGGGSDSDVYVYSSASGEDDDEEEEEEEEEEEGDSQMKKSSDD